MPCTAWSARSPSAWPATHRYPSWSCPSFAPRTAAADVQRRGPAVTVVTVWAALVFIGLVTLIVFLTYQQVENHILNPVVMSRTTKINPLLVLVSILVGTSIGEWIGGTFGAFVAALVSIPLAGAPAGNRPGAVAGHRLMRR